MVDFERVNDNYSSDGYLYHTTFKDTLSSILEEGLIPDKDSPEKKEEMERAEELGMTLDEFRQYSEGSPMVKARKWMENLLLRARIDRTDVSDLPPHDGSVFFWTQRNKAVGVAHQMDVDGFVVVVDPDGIPCECAVADNDMADDIWNYCYNIAKDGGSIDEDVEYGIADDFWDTARTYSGQRGSTLEVWCDCDIPKSAIVKVLDDEGELMLDLEDPTEVQSL